MSDKRKSKETMQNKARKKTRCDEPYLLFHPSSVIQPNFVSSQVKWWFLVTTIIALSTLVPAIFVAKDVQHWIELADSVLITFGVRTLALLSKLIIQKLFNFINEGNLPYSVCCRDFFTNDNPLNQFLWERKIRNGARGPNKRHQKHGMASHPKIWLVLIVLSYVVRLAPDMLGASLVAQSKPFRLVEPIDSIVAPDLGFGNSSGLQLRGNCVWTRARSDTRATRSADATQDETNSRFGFIIWQYCVDLFRDEEVDSEFRTLRGVDRNGDRVKAVFHIEVITEQVFTESWEPFSNKTQAQLVFDSVISSVIECPDDICMKNYRTDDMRIIYALLKQVGMHKRELRGDDDSLEKLRVSVGRVIARLPKTTRTSFLVLIVAVNLIFLAQSMSNTEEVEHIALFRAIGELKQRGVANNFTAIALPPTDMTRQWVKDRHVECFVVGNESCSAIELLQKVPEVRGTYDEHGELESYTRGGKRYVKGTADSEMYSWAHGTHEMSVEKEGDV